MDGVVMLLYVVLRRNKTSTSIPTGLDKSAVAAILACSQKHGKRTEVVTAIVVSYICQIIVE